MSNKGRILTLCVEITDPEEAAWIWNAHIGRPTNGIQVRVIANGDRLSSQRESDTVEVPRKFYIQEEGETLQEAIEASCYDFSDLDEAVEAAPKNVNPGSKWDVIDQTGKVYFSGTAPWGRG